MNFTQKKDYALGNTIMCTPGLIKYHQETGQKVKAYFESNVVRSMFWNAPFLNIVDEPVYEEFHSGIINRHISDYEYFHERICLKYGFENENVPYPYVDTFDDAKVTHKKVVIVRGCASPHKRHTKDPGDITYIKIINDLQNKGFDCVFLGSESDYTWNLPIIKETGVKFVSRTIRYALKEIQSSDFVIMNDTGLYHAAGAMKKKGLIMWKDTNFEKNKSPNKNFIYSTYRNYFEDYKYLLEKIC